jgi:DNA gyrase subunit A
VKKTKLSEYDSPRSTGLIAITLREGDTVVAAQLVNSQDDLMLVSKDGFSVRFSADDDTLRPMGRTAGGVGGMKWKRPEDYLLAMEVARPDAFLVTVTENGFGKRTGVDQWNRKGRNTMGVRVMSLNEKKGGLAGAAMCEVDDEIYGIASNGVVIRTTVEGLPATGRDTQGRNFMDVEDDVVVTGVARYSAAMQRLLQEVQEREAAAAAADGDAASVGDTNQEDES